MTRPAFLSRPDAWTRTPRVSQTPAEYAEPIHRAEVERQGRAADAVIAWFIALILTVWAVSALVDRFGG